MDNTTKTLLAKLTEEQIFDLLDNVQELIKNRSCDDSDIACILGGRLSKLGITLLEKGGCRCNMNIVNKYWDGPVIYVTPENINGFSEDQSG